MNFDPDRLVAFDTETYLIKPGVLAPPMVCGSWANQDTAEILDKQDCRETFQALLKSNAVITGANIAYDMLVMIVDLARQGIDVSKDVFEKYERNEVYDVQIAEMLHAIGRGHLNKYPNGKPFPGGKRYSLDMVCRLVLGTDDAKKNDRWRLRYSELGGLPLHEWPNDAKEYPIDDVRNPLEIALAQLGVTTRPPEALNGFGQWANQNLHDVSNQVYTAWAMHLGAAWGLQANQQLVDVLEASVIDARKDGIPKWFSLGIRREPKKKDPPEGTLDSKLLAQMVVEAYGCIDTCEHCLGICRTCESTGRVPAKTAGKTKICPICRGDKFPRCDACMQTGRVLISAVPRTETGLIAKGRDSLIESDDATLIEYAEWGAKSKVIKTYVPFLRQPNNIRPNVLVETGRTSYRGVIQLLPRDMGVRECLEAREGYYYLSCDYGQLELFTHAESCKRLGLPSKLAEDLNNGVDVHVKLAAMMMGITYQEGLQKHLEKDPLFKLFRQAAKAVNYGFPGGMGAATLVIASRDDSSIRTGKFRGLRFCMTVGGRDDCGNEKVTEWKRRPLPPTCKKCIEVAEDLRNLWFAAWPENRYYFKLIGDLTDRQDFMIQHVSKRRRGGVYFTNAANGYFQGLAADGAKHALRRVSRECYCIENSPLFGTRPIGFFHDEIFCETPIEKARRAGDRLAEIMVETMREYVPSVAENLTAEPTLMRFWDKNAETVRDSSGKLMVWEP